MSEVNKIPKRSEVDPKYTWATEDIFKTEEDWQAALEKAAAYPAKLASYAGRLSESAATLLEYRKLVDDMTRDLMKIYSYTSLKSDEDKAVAKYQDMQNKAVSLLVQVNAASAFETPEIIAIDEEILNAFYAESPELAVYKGAMDEMRRMKDHILSDKEEALLASAREMAGTPENVFGLFENADLKFPSVTDSEGKEYPLTNGSFIPLMESSDRTLRENAFKTFYGTYKKFENTTAGLLDGQAKKLLFFSRARKYPGTLEASLDATNVPVEVYKNLIETVHTNMPKMHKYMRLRKKLMGLDELHMYDIYAPIVAEADVKIPYEEAKQNVLDTVSVLGEDYVNVVKHAFENRWIDVYENEGKRSGAYSSGVADPHPYVLLNHKDTLDSEFTLIHEMGHAMHSYLSCKNQPLVYADYVIFVAEVASTCNEALLMQNLLKKTTDKKQRAYLINYFLEQFRTTLYRQTMFAEFEMKIGELAATGAALTAEALNKMYYDLNKLYYGDEMVVDDEIALEWSRIPHFYYNYYVFQYATGFSAAIALSERILSGGEEAVKDYLSFLSGGCSKTPIELLRMAGVDMATPEPIDKALALFDSLIDQLEELLAD